MSAKKDTKKQSEKVAVQEQASDDATAVEVTPTIDTQPDSSSQAEFDVMELSRIESTEVGTGEGVTESVDPDKEIAIPTQTPVVQTQWWQQKKIFIPVIVLLLLVALQLIPQVRFFALGWVWKTTAEVVVKDAATGNPVTNASVMINTTKAMTNESGVAKLAGIGIGQHTAVVQKTNYKPASQRVTVDIPFANVAQPVQVEASGTVVEVSIKDRLTGKAISDVVVSDGDDVTYGRTNKNGKLSVVVPLSSNELPAVLSLPGYKVQGIKVTKQQKDFTLIPEGSVYFLSKQSGKIDVIKTAVDGSERKVIVPGTGDENNETTTLLTSQDWKYAMLKSKRAPNKPEAFYLVTAANDSYKVMDEGTTLFTPIGWIGHSFIYQTERQNADFWRAKTFAIKSYNADTGETSIVDENANDQGSTAQTALYESMGNYAIIDGLLTYTKTWYMYGTGMLNTVDKQSTVMTVKADGTERKVVRSFSADQIDRLTAKLYAPQEVRYQVIPKIVNATGKITYGELKSGAYTDSAIPFTSFDTDSYPTYLMSPDGTASFWSEERDGKNVLFVGDKNAANKQELRAKSDFVAYGWLTSDWLLLQKDSNELYITTKEQLISGGEPLKVSDYHKLKNSLAGYGYGYGGQ